MADAENKPDFEQRRDAIMAAMETVETADADRTQEREERRAKKAAASTPEPKPETETEQPANEPTPEPEGEQPAPVEGEQPEVTETSVAASATEPPANWPQSAKEMFKEQSPEAQKFLLERQKAMDADYTRKTMEIAGFKKEYGAIDEMFSPFKQQMQRAGHTPFTMVQAWMNVERALMDPASRERTFLDIGRAYGIDTSKLTGSAQPSTASADPKATEVDAFLEPYLKPFKEEIADLKGQLGKFGEFQNQSMTQRQMDAVQRVQAEIDQFANTKTDKGELAHPYFAEVQDDMARLAQGYRASNQTVPSLEELYQTAVRANPSTYDRLIAAQRQTAVQKQNEEARAKAAKAKKAGSSVTGAPRSGQPRLNGAGNPNSIRGSLEAAAEEVFSR